MFSYDVFGGTMTLREAHFRGAHARWMAAKRKWHLALMEINNAKEEWERAQSEFFTYSLTATDCSACPFKEEEE